MNKLDLLGEAIDQQKPIRFEYLSESSPEGIRYGNPHAIYISEMKNVNIHIWKTDGVKSDPSQEFPFWRTYTVKKIKNIKILKKKPQFSVAPDYKPNSPLYSKVITKV